MSTGRVVLRGVHRFFRGFLLGATTSFSGTLSDQLVLITFGPDWWIDGTSIQKVECERGRQRKYFDLPQLWLCCFLHIWDGLLSTSVASFASRYSSDLF